MSIIYPQDPVVFADHCRELDQDSLLNLVFTLQADSIRVASQLEEATHRKNKEPEWFLKSRTAQRYINLRLDIAQQMLKRRRMWESTFVQCARAVLSNDEYASIKAQAEAMTSV